MPNPSLVVGHRFKDDSGILFLPFELSMPCRRTILPTPMHTIYGAKHSGKSPSRVLLQEPSCVLGIGGSQICGAIDLHNGHNKPLDTLDSGALTHGQVVINQIRWYTICQHPQSGGHLLIGAMPKLSSGIPPLHKISIISGPLLCDALEQTGAHPK